MHCFCSMILIIFGVILLSNSLLLKFGMGFIIRMGFPIGLYLMPLNQNFMAWIDIPIPMELVARIKGAKPLHPTGGSVGAGLMELEMDLGKWEDADDENAPKLTEVILIQETAEIDQIQHYKVVLGKLWWSKWNFLSGCLMFLGFLGMGGGAVWKVISSKNSKGQMVKEWQGKLFEKELKPLE